MSDEIVERIVTFGDGGQLVGTMTTPAAQMHVSRDDAGALGVILFNAGVIPRVGPHRLNVKLARRFAREGIPVLRFDLSGQGDSLASTSTLGFEQQSVADVRSAMDELSVRMGTTRFVLFGICSGAVLSYAAALEDPRIVGCAMLDPYMYPTWRTHLNRMLARFRARGFRKVGAGWLERRGRGLLRMLGLGGAKIPRRDPMSGLGLKKPPQQAFAAGLHQLLDRRVELLMLYSGSVLYSYNYAAQFDDGFRRFGLAGKVPSEYCPDIDHTVTTLSAQRELSDLLVNWVERRFPAAMKRAAE